MYEDEDEDAEENDDDDSLTARRRRVGVRALEVWGTLGTLWPRGTRISAEPACSVFSFLRNLFLSKATC